MSAPQQSKTIVRATKSASTHQPAGATKIVAKKPAPAKSASATGPKPGIAKATVKTTTTKKPVAKKTTATAATATAAVAAKKSKKDDEGDRCDVDEARSSDGDDKGSDMDDFVASDSSVSDVDNDALTLEKYQQHMAEIKSMYGSKLKGKLPA